MTIVLTLDLLKWLCVAGGVAAIGLPALYALACLCGVNPLVGRSYH